MRGLRKTAALLLLLSITSLNYAQDKVLLKNEMKPGDGWHLALDMKLTGKIKLRDGDKVVGLDLKAGAKHEFEERVLTVSEGKPTSVGRFYNTAKADITLQDKSLTKTLRSDRRFIAAHTSVDSPTITYSPVGPLTDEELEITAEHLDVLALHGLLPNKEVAIGEKWDVSIPVAQSLAGVDAVISSKLECKLEKIERNHAVVTLTGELEGILKGATLKASLAAGLVYSLETKKFTGCTWRYRENKDQGPLNPACEIETEVTATWKHGLALTEVTDGKAATIAAQPPAALLMLEFRDANNRFAFHYDRQWGVVSKNEKQVVMRLLDRGELIAQMNLNPYQQMKPGEHMSLDEIEKLIQQAPGYQLEKVIEKANVDAAPGFWIGKVSTTGTASDLPMQQVVYAVAGPRGDQVLLSFTVETEQAAKLAGRDLSLVKTVSLPTLQTTGGTK
ncbi:MAG: hypothetical protein JNJ77_14010 [Planctomycetia bacterium]|nr:hypothetical protein [Planctomycetia bacterium]